MQYGPDQPVVHILLLIVFLAAGVWFYRKRSIGADRFSLTARQYRRLIIAVAGFYLIWLLITMYWPNSDQRMAVAVARPFPPVGGLFSVGCGGLCLCFSDGSAGGKREDISVPERPDSISGGCSGTLLRMRSRY